MSINERTVRFMRRQDALDLYRCVDADKNTRVYARMLRTTDPNSETVHWTTTSRWTGGYEPDCPLKAGIALKIVDDGGNYLFTEVVTGGDSPERRFAVKQAPFSYEEEKRLSEKIAKENQLISWEEWSVEMTRSRNQYAPSEYIDNWKFAPQYRRNISTTNAYVRDGLGRRLRIECSLIEHTVSQQKWYEYSLMDGPDCVAICGFKWA